MERVGPWNLGRPGEPQIPPKRYPGVWVELIEEAWQGARGGSADPEGQVEMGELVEGAWPTEQAVPGQGASWGVRVGALLAEKWP